MHIQRNSPLREQRLAHQLPSAKGGPLDALQKSAEVGMNARNSLGALSHGINDALFQKAGLESAATAAKFGLDLLLFPATVVLSAAALIGITRWSFRKAFGK